MSFKHLSKLAVACPGQGILPRGCLYEFRLMQPLFSHSLQCVDESLKENFTRHLLAPPLASIDAWGLSTANAQPAIVAATYVMAEVLKKAHGVDLATHARVSHFLGHSLGEYSALLLTGVLSLDEAVTIVRRRGELMQDLVKLQKYEMRSLLLKPLLYELVHNAAAKRGVLACANNASLIAVSGTALELDDLVLLLNGSKKTVLKQTQLPVSVPFHNRLLETIEPALLSCRTHSRQGTKPIVSNFSGAESKGDVYANTVLGTSKPVQWKKSIEFLKDRGVGSLVNLGPGTAVSTINSRFDVQNFSAGSPQDLKILADVFERSPSDVGVCE